MPFARAVQLHQAGRLDEARLLYEAAIQAAPDHAEALHMLGYLWFQKGDADRALDLIGRAVALRPGEPGYQFNRALILQQSGRLEEADAAFEGVIALRPADADAWTGRGEVLLGLDRPDEALAALDRALALRPGDPALQSNRGVALRRLGRAAEALAAFDGVIARAPNDADAHANRGNALRDLLRPAEALASYDRALALAPDAARTHANRGAALRDLGRLDDALAAYDRAAALTPDDPQAHYHRGLVLADLRRPDEALAAYDRSLALSPDDPQTLFSAAVVHLLGGDFARGWPLYEARRRLPGAPGAPAAPPTPLWLGEQPLDGRTLLLLAEQGLGDTLQFCRYAALLARKGARVILQAQPALMSLLEGLEGVDALTAAGQPPPAHDLHCPLMSMPLALGTTADSIPSLSPYLKPDPRRVAAWEAVLGPRRARRVGLVWSGRAEHRNDAHRSLAFATLIAALPPDLDYVSLQKEVRASDERALAASPVRHFGPRLHDFADTAALASLMDVVVSVDTSLPHLAGSLGQDVRLLLSRVGQDWRWLAQGAASPWYPSMTLYRQDADCRWDAPLARVAQAL